ncbi:vWA domain-containing protein [Azotobacter vinelandii]|uniref:vWA domain-containing protein n=1 Tax=Azotobacter vinelandii TaxID=354 RepID=UPI0039F58B04
MWREMALLGGLLLGACAGPALAADDKPLLQAGKKTLYQRVLTTPSCRLGDQPGAAGGKPQPAFTRFYVYQRQKVGDGEWLKVGPDSYGKTLGWIDAGCAVDWKMQMTLALTNPAGREPLLFFRQRETLDKLFGADDPGKLLKPIRANLAGQGRDAAVVAREPDYAVDLAKRFYLLPVLDAREIMTEKGFRVRELEVASVTAAEPKSAEQAARDKAGEVNTLKGFSAAVVFVIDSTISMGPYIDRTREAIRKIYQRIEQEKLLEQVRFGLVAYRSNIKEVPALEYVSKLYVDPAKVQGGEDFLAKMAALKPATVSSSRFDEDAYAGVMRALDGIDWTRFGARYIVLVSDAGALDGTDPLSATGLDAAQVRLEAKHRGVAIYSLHLKTPSGAKNHASAEAQYRDLSNNPILNKPLYYPVDAGDVDNFGSKIDALAVAITGQVKAAYRGEMAAGSALGADADYGGKADATLLEDTAKLGHAMRLAYLGAATGASAPPVFHAWIGDRDFVKQNVPTTEVRVLLTKAQLSDLAEVVKKIADAANEGLISPNEMFERLRSVAATMGKDPNQLQKGGKSATLAEMGLMAEYLEGLPYLSEVLSLDEETWKGMEGLEQEKFIRRLNTKLKYYQKYNADADRWVSLAEGSDPRDHVYPVPLEALP